MEKAGALKEKNVLLVDDNPSNVFALVSYLEAREMNVLIAESGFEALEILDGNKKVDIILMDIMMPEMDGFEAIRRINSNDKIKSIPIIAVTAKAMVGDREKCIEAGASDYISKPVDIMELQKKMLALI